MSFGPWPRRDEAAAGGGELDYVRSHPDHLPHHGPDLVHAVGDARGDAGVVVHRGMVARWAALVGQAAGGGNRPHGHLKAGPNDEPLLDGQPEPRIHPSRVAHRRVAAQQRLLQHLGRSQVTGAAGLPEPPPAPQVVLVDAKMVVAVYQAGEQGHPGHVNDLRSLRDPHLFTPARRLYAPVAADDYGGVPEGLGARAVDECAAGERFHASLPGAGRRRRRVLGSAIVSETGRTGHAPTIDNAMRLL